MRRSLVVALLGAFAVLLLCGCNSPRTSPGSTAPILYVSLREGQSIAGFDPQSGRRQFTIRVPGTIADGGIRPADPGPLTLWPGASLGFVSCPNAERLAVIDFWNARLKQMIAVDRLSGSTALTADGRFLYVSSATQAIAVVDVEQQSVVDRIEVGAGTRALVLAGDGARIYAATDRDSVVAVDVAARRVAGTISVGTLPTGLALRPRIGEMYVTLGRASDGKVVVIDLASLRVVKTIGVGADPIAVTFDPSGNTAYVLNRESRTISVVDAVAGTLRSSFPSLGQTGAFLLSPQADEIYVSHPDRDAISVIGIDGKLRRVLDVSAQGPQMPSAMAMPQMPSPG